jgi:GNAT superfamily N-acetyltransferase
VSHLADIEIRLDPWPPELALAELRLAAWGGGEAWTADVLRRSLAHLGAYDGERLVGFAYVATDGHHHAFLLDPSIHPDYQRRGVGMALVRRAIDAARERGAGVVHVDYEPHLATFYAACGFRPSAAVRLR